MCASVRQWSLCLPGSIINLITTVTLSDSIIFYAVNCNSAGVFTPCAAGALMLSSTWLIRESERGQDIKRKERERGRPREVGGRWKERVTMSKIVSLSK